MTTRTPADRWNAGITWLDEPLRRAANGPLAGTHAARQGSHRHGRHPDDVRVSDLRGARPGRVTRSVVQRRSTRVRRSSARGTFPSSPGACSARTSGTARCTTPCSPAARPVARRAETRRRSPPGSATWRSAPIPAARSDCRRPPATSSASSREWGRSRLDGVYPLVPVLRHRRADGPHGRGRRRALVGARPDVASPSRASTGCRRPPAPGARHRRRARDRAKRRRRGVGGRPRRARARGSSRRPIPDATADTWPVFLHEAARSHAATFPRRADEYGDVMRAKLEAARA